MTKLTENTIEQLTIEALKSLDYQYIYAPNLAHDGEKLVEGLDEYFTKIPSVRCEKF